MYLRDTGAKSYPGLECQKRIAELDAKIAKLKSAVAGANSKRQEMTCGSNTCHDPAVSLENSLDALSAEQEQILPQYRVSHVEESTLGESVFSFLAWNSI